MNLKQYLWALAALGCSSHALGAGVPTTDHQLLKQLDFDGSGLLSKEEIYAGLSHKVKAAKTISGTSADDAETYLAGLIKKGKPSKDDIVGEDGTTLDLLYSLLLREKGLTDSPPFAFRDFDPKRDFFLDDVYEKLPTKEELKEMPYKPTKGNFSLRRNKDETEMPAPGDVAAQKKGALISYSNNFLNDTDQWIFRGALIYSYSEVSNPHFTGESPVLDSMSWNAFAALDKVSTGNGDKDEVDSLDFGIERKLHYIPRSFKWTYDLSYGATLNTDTDLDHLTYKAVIDFEPVVNALGMAGFSDFNLEKLPFLLYWTLKIHGEGGAVGDAGDNKRLEEEGYFRLGGKASIHVTPKSLPRLSLETSFLHYQTLASDMDSPSYFEAEARYRITEFRSRVPAYLVVNYRNGTLEDTLAEEDRLTLGLSIAF